MQLQQFPSGTMTVGPGAGRLTRRARPLNALQERVFFAVIFTLGGGLQLAAVILLSAASG
jgi:hypothetical protein